jgi:putative transcriptional regulator
MSARLEATRSAGCNDVRVLDDRSRSAAPGSEVAPGTLLVAAPGLLDPHFRRTVVYII